MNMKELNARRLSNGMTRGAYYDSLNRDFEQEPRVYNGAFVRQLDIPYGTDSDRQKYDVYMPLSPGRCPTIVWVHGGGWFMGDRSDFALGYILPYILHGYTVVSIGYRLANEAVFPGPVDDVCAGLRQMAARAAEYRIDPARVCIMSGSAGTDIAVLAALRNPGLIRCAAMQCSILDFRAMRRQFEQIGLRRERFAYPDEDTSIEALYLGASVLEDPALADRANPLYSIPADCPHFLMIHGLIDVDTPYLQSVEFAEAVRRVTGDQDRAELVLLPDTGHDNGLYDMPENFERKLDYMRRIMK